MSEGAVVDIMSIVALHTGSMGDIGKREAISKSTLGGFGQGRDWLGHFGPEQIVNAGLMSLRTHSHWSIQ